MRQHTKSRKGWRLVKDGALVKTGHSYSFMNTPLCGPMLCPRVSSRTFLTPSLILSS